MQKQLAIALALLIAAVVAVFVFWGEGAGPAPAPTDVGRENVGVVEAAGDQGSLPAQGQGGSGAIERTQVATSDPDLFADPEIQAGLCGFRGRVLTHDRQPVADCGVRFYRGAIDSILNREFDVFAEGPSAEPQYVAGESRTAPDGRFLVAGVWPAGMYILFAGIGTDAPMHQVVTETPSPGEIVDLGDIVLPDAGVIVGTVVDAEGQPLAGALVRAADVPGTLAGFFPVERFDPEGALLIRERNSPIAVVEMPRWVKDAFEHLPIPTTRTAGDGSFRLVGVVPGSNMLAVNAPDHLAEVKPSVIVRAGAEKDVGAIRLREGEELIGRVVDTKGEPVAGAEVYAGSTINLTPFDLARPLIKSDEKGRFAGLGFTSGKVTVAARRAAGHAWVLAEPQPILSDVVVTLPATYGVDLTITTASGEPANEPRLRLLKGRAGDGAAEMVALGFVPPIDLRERLQEKEEPGQWRISNLQAGRYTLVADVPGHATGFVMFTIEEADVTAALALSEEQNFAVRVVDVEERPVRNAAIYAEASGRQLFDMPLMCGRTKSDGTLIIDRYRADELRVSAEHPKYGVVHGAAKLGEELVLRMLPPGSIQGILTENGAAPDPGKYTVLVEWRRNDGPRGPYDMVPRMVSAGTDGRFRVAALQPGQYRLMVLDSIAALRSPGGVVQMAMSQSFFSGNQQRVTVDVISGQTAQTQLEVGEQPIEGPTAHLFGSVMVDGRFGEGYPVMAFVGGRRYMESTDRAGRFDFGTVPAGDVYLSVANNDGLLDLGMSSLWSDRFELKEAEQREVAVEVLTSAMAGEVVDAAGAPVAGVAVTARGRPPGSKEGSASWTTRLHTPTDSAGRFRFETVPAGQWTLEVHGGSRSLRGRIDGLVVAPGAPVTGLRIELAPVTKVSGRIDGTMFGNEKPRWAWLSIHTLGPDGRSLGDHVAGIGVNMNDLAFSTDELVPGSYGVRVHAAGGRNRNDTYRCQDLIVPPQGLENVLLRGVPE